MKFKKLKLPSNKKFGIFFTSIFLFLSIFFWYKNYFILPLVFIFFAFIFLFLSLFKPLMLQPLNRLWMNFGLLLGKIISPIILGIIYFALITPFAYSTRLFGRDELGLRSVNKSSYWLKRKTLIYSKSFKHQF